MVLAQAATMLCCLVPPPCPLRQPPALSPLSPPVAPHLPPPAASAAGEAIDLTDDTAAPAAACSGPSAAVAANAQAGRSASR